MKLGDLLQIGIGGVISLVFLSLCFPPSCDDDLDFAKKHKARQDVEMLSREMPDDQAVSLRKGGVTPVPLPDRCWSTTPRMAGLDPWGRPYCAILVDGK
jgi:hypothetical protein